MKGVFKNTILLFLSLLLSYFLCLRFGFWYSDFSGGLGSSWIGAKGAWESLIGFPFAYIFFSVLLLKLFGSGNKKKWILWSSSPGFLFFISFDLKHIYVPIVLGLIAYLLATLLQRIWVRIKMKRIN